MKDKPEIQVGGQAVIEGVMMRGPKSISTAVRKKDDSILIKKESFISKTKTNKFCGLPIIRGFVSLIEMLSIGFRSLNFSAEEAIKDEEKADEEKKESSWDKFYQALSYVFAFGLAFLFFVFLPYRIAYWVNIEKTSFIFNLFTGAVRIVFFVAYVFSISLLKDIRHLFEFHGAEHKTVFAYEKNPEFSLEDTKTFTTHHPRCGTSFIFIVLIIAILVFSIFDSLLVLFFGFTPPLLIRIGLHFLLLPFISGISYEILKFSGKNINNVFVRIFTAPGLFLQYITTKEPDEKQLEVAICALRSALDQEVNNKNVKFVGEDGNQE